MRKSGRQDWLTAASFPLTIVTVTAVAVLMLGACSTSTVPLDFSARIVGADKEPQNWLSHGWDYAEARDSPLDQINDSNVGWLGLAWHYDLDTNRGQEATPLAVDGTLYTTSAWSKVQAFDGVSGRLLWQFDPKVPGQAAVNACCDVVNRGAAYWDGKLFIGTIDGRLIGLDAKTGAGKWYAPEGGLGGGTVWDGITYDPETNLLFLGVGNGALWNRNLHSDGQGDNVFLSSILALQPETGEYVWHYQEVPGDEWDYTATQQMTLADIEIGGHMRKVIMQAPKNDFFYILDRKTGEQLSAEPYATVNWATHVDLKTGRPAIVPAARWSETGKPFLSYPNGEGAHNWHPMPYSRRTGLMYIPVQNLPNLWVADPNFKRMPLGLNVGYDPMAMRAPEDAKTFAAAKASLKGYLLAWDPRSQKEVGERRLRPYPTAACFQPRGTLSCKAMAKACSGLMTRAPAKRFGITRPALPSWRRSSSG